MYPEICKIGPLTVYSYGLMFALAVMICVFLVKRQARKQGLNPDLLYDLAFYMALTGIVGARIFYILLNLNFFIAYPQEILMLHRGGLAWQGGLIGSCLFGLIFIKINKLPFWKTMDVLAPYAALGQAIGRFGCFLNGCCFGRHLDKGIYFPVHNDTLHPTQVYATIGLLTIFFVLIRYRTHSDYDGAVFVRYLMYASILRFFIEFFRADHYVYVLGLSVFQIVCLVVFSLAIYANLRIKSQARR